MFERKQLKILRNRLEEKTSYIQILSGTRQVGKTTLVEQLLQYINFPYQFSTADNIPSSDTNWISIQWETARVKLKTSDAASVLLIIDEVQKIDNWSDAVKKEWDEDRRKNVNVKVILLGSSALLIDKGLTESLTGRFEIIFLPHWDYIEMHDAFGFTEDQYLYFGSYPGSAGFIHDEKRWKDYILNSIIETTISKDIVMLTNIKKPALLKNLFEVSCMYSSQILSYTKIIGNLSDKGNTITLAHYQFLLDKIWFISGLQKYSGSKISLRNSIPKWNVYNNAFFNVYSNLSPNDCEPGSAIYGRLVESAIGSYLLNQCRINNINLYYWREGNNEVDFILKKGSKLISLEVKSGTMKSNSGQLQFANKFKTFKTIVVSNDTINWKEFIKLDINGLFD
ncbi:MAG TPA: AAA family ATPase [Ignavibacteria bacterium]|nr:AAA family ATPase [Bacteroidota bacterium]HRE10203.1 AAA family ATPase [Ignavibacteria bacterium]HRF65349.1 AAA family ATPase [Ignavibacteria bacterium]HRJ03957.1 AAA family ATPase [Ignavibacteria bacterium]